jgi:hypothetical protein
MLSARYGTNVIVGGSDSPERARLREYSNTYVYYFDEQNHLNEQVVNQLVSIKNQPVTPLDFNVPIRFESYELVKDALKHGEALVLLLYWRSMGIVEKDYTVFVHMSNEKKEIVAAADSQPRAGHAPTTSWKPNQFVVDWSVIPITDEIPSGRYNLEIGMYYLPTMERLSFKDEKGLLKDTIVIQPIEILE